MIYDESVKGWVRLKNRYWSACDGQLGQLMQIIPLTDRQDGLGSQVKCLDSAPKGIELAWTIIRETISRKGE